MDALFVYKPAPLQVNVFVELANVPTDEVRNACLELVKFTWDRNRWHVGSVTI